MEKESRKKYLFKNTILFSIGNFGSKIITFFLVPLYTNVLTASQYGTVDLITVLATVIAPIITLNISEAVMRFLMDKNDNKSEILNISIIICFVAFILSLLLIPVFKLFSVTSEYSLLLSLYLFSFSISTILMCYIRGMEKLMYYSIISIIQTLIIAILNIVFLMKFKLGIPGYILAYSFAYIVSSVLCIILGKIFREFKTLKVNKRLLSEMTKYSLLLIPNALMWWIMNSLDRVMITSMINIDANGIYAVSYKIPTILMTLTSIFNQAWMYSAVKEKDSDDKDEYTNNVLKNLSIIIITTAAFLTIILKPLMSVYVGNAFFEAWKYVPPLLIGTVFLTMATFLSNEYTVHKDSAGFLKSSTIGAVVNLILNFLLINLFGILGAAVATCVGYLTVLIFRVFDTKKYVKINYKEKKVYINLLLLLLMSLSVYLNGIISYILMILICILLLLNNMQFYKMYFINVTKKSQIVKKVI